WMKAREALCRSALLGEDLEKILPIVVEGGSDSAIFDNVLELLVMAGRPLPLAVLMMIPEAWSGHESMSAERKDFYEYHGCLMEPRSGPASTAFTDGTVIGAVLDRNGLRPSRYYITKDGLVVMASEVGVLDIPPERVLIKERLHPGRIFLVDTAQGRIIDDGELKHAFATRYPYGEWLATHLKPLETLPEPPELPEPDHDTVLQRQQAFGPTPEACRQIKLKTPILDNVELARIRHVDLPGFKATTVPMLFPVADGAKGLARAMDELCRRASLAVAEGFSYLILSDRGVDREHA